jgi:hypothetical protein
VYLVTPSSLDSTIRLRFHNQCACRGERENQMNHTFFDFSGLSDKITSGTTDINHSIPLTKQKAVNGNNYLLTRSPSEGSQSDAAGTC